MVKYKLSDMNKLLLLLLLLLLSYLIYQISPVSFSSEEIRFVIGLDEETPSVINRLKNEKLVRNNFVFNYFNIEPGSYLLKRNHWLPQTVNILLYRPFQKWAVLRPGLRREQVAEILAGKFNWDVLGEKQFLDNAPEGYLYPDTYLLNVDYSPKEFAQKLINNFNEKFNAQMQKDLLSQDVRNDTAIKIASLIERESGSLEDKAIISGIIWNRLNDGMKLQIDATTQYIKGTRGNWWPQIKPADHKTESPYNTYLNKGLPPGPIASPSLDAIIAAVYPAETKCFYYLHDKDKNIHCGKTYKDHLENIEKYLK